MREPGYWMYEQSGILVPAVKRFLEGEELTIRDIGLMRAYLKQWIDSEVWDANPSASPEGKRELMDLRLEVRAIRDRGAIERWLSKALDFGMDPL